MIAPSVGGFIVATAVVAARMASLAAQRGGGGPQALDNAPTPHMADGHPDLNGWWGGGGGGVAGGRTLADLTDEKGNVYLQLNARSQGSALGTTSGQLAENFERDSGVARMGFPNKIVMNPSEVVFLYDTGNTFRWIPINTPHHQERDASYKGDSVAKWDGDTLVVDTTNFNDQTWLGWPGYFHSDELHVIERLTRTGNTIKYEAIVEDPKVLQKPWVWNPRIVGLNTDANAAFWEDPPCDDQDLEHIVTKERG